MIKRERYDKATPYYGEKTQSEIDADTIEALRAEKRRLENAVIELVDENRLVGLQMDRFADEIARLREALKPFADLGMRQAPGSDGDTFIVNIPSAKAIRAARAAMGESDDAI